MEDQQDRIFVQSRWVPFAALPASLITGVAGWRLVVGPNSPRYDGIFTMVFGSGLIVIAVVATVLAIVHLVRPQRLILTAEGFAVEAVWRRNHTRWCDTGSFFIVKLPGLFYLGLKPVGFTHSQKARVALERRSPAWLRLTEHGEIPYGFWPGDKLCALMTEWRSEHCR